MRLVGPNQFHPQANGSLRMRCWLSQASIIYMIYFYFIIILHKYNDIITYGFI